MFIGNRLLLAILFKNLFGWSDDGHSQSHFTDQRFNMENEQNMHNSFSVTDPLFFIETVGEDQAFASPFGCCIQEVLLCCHPLLSEECIATRLSLAQCLETTLNILSTATDNTGWHSNHGFSNAINLVL